MQKNPTEYAVGEIKTEIEFDIDKIPNEAIKDLAKTFLPDILAFYENEEGKKNLKIGNIIKKSLNIQQKKKQGANAPCKSLEKKNISERFTVK